MKYEGYRLEGLNWVYDYVGVAAIPRFRAVALRARWRGSTFL